MNRIILGPEYFPTPTIGRPISSAQIFVGNPDTDPEVVINQKQVSIQQEDGTIVAVSQPILTGIGGVPIYLGSPVTVLVNGDYALKVLDSGGSQIYYVPSQAGLVVINKVDDMKGLVDITGQSDGDSADIFGFFFTAPESNPKGGGQFIWQDGVNKTTANGGTIVDPDNIGGFDGTLSTIVAFLAAQGAGVGTGCWVRTQNSILNPEMFGAVTNTDSSAALNAIADAINDGDKIIFNDIFLIDSSAMTIQSKDNFVLQGPGGLKFVNGITDGNILVIDDSEDVLIDGLELDGNIAGGSEGNRSALTISNLLVGACSRVTISGCYIHDTKGTTSPTDAVGISLQSPTDVIIENCIIHDTDVGVLARITDNLSVSGCLIEGGSSESISLWGGAGSTQNTNCLINNNILTKTLAIHCAKNINVSGNKIITTTIGGGATGNYDYIAEGVTFAGNQITGILSIGYQNGSLTTTSAKDILIASNMWLIDTGDYVITTPYKAENLSIKGNKAVLGKNLSGAFIFGSPVLNLIIENNDIDLNGYTCNRFITTSVDTFPIKITGNKFVGTPINEGMWIQATTTTDCIVSDNIIPDGSIRKDTAGIIVKDNISNRTGIELLTPAATLTLYNAYQSDDRFYKFYTGVNITSIVATRPNHEVTFIFTGVCTVIDGSNLKLNGNFSGTADDVLKLVCDGTDWFEVSRSAN